MARADVAVYAGSITIRNEWVNRFGQFPRQVRFGPVVHSLIVVDRARSCSRTSGGAAGSSSNVGSNSYIVDLLRRNALVISNSPEKGLAATSAHLSITAVHHVFAAIK
jgi:hypothetical protein